MADLTKQRDTARGSPTRLSIAPTRSVPVAWFRPDRTVELRDETEHALADVASVECQMLVSLALDVRAQTIRASQAGKARAGSESHARNGGAECLSASRQGRSHTCRVEARMKLSGLIDALIATGGSTGSDPRRRGCRRGGR